MAMRDEGISEPEAGQAGGRFYALEITGKDIGQIEVARGDIQSGTQVNIAFLGNETHAQRISAARVIRACGLEPVPIISSRRLKSQDDADELISALVEEAAPKRFLFVGGDPSQPGGPYADSLALLRSGIVDRHKIRQAGIVAYPEGHPKISTETLWDSLKWKAAFLKSQDCSVEITTQFGFDSGAIIQWLRRLRTEGIDAPVRIGIPGPADVGKLLRFARQFGVVASTAIARRYGLSLTNLLQRVGPERFWDQLADGMRDQDLGVVLYHLYPFGGVAEGVRWMNGRLSSKAEIQS